MLLKEDVTDQNRKIFQYILVKLNDVKDVTCSPYDCNGIFLDYTNKDYLLILNLSKMFLYNSISSNYLGNSDSFCFLFPADLLFESFIGGYLKSEFESSDDINVHTQTRQTYLADLIIDDEQIDQVMNLREDILIEKDNKIVILDTKYKLINTLSAIKANKDMLNVDEDDVRQVAIYALKRKAEKVFLIYPLAINEEFENINILLNIDLYNKKINIPCYILKVPFIIDDQKNNLSLLKKIINEIILQ